MFGQRHRRWASMETTLWQYFILCLEDRWFNVSHLTFKTLITTIVGLTLKPPVPIIYISYILSLAYSISAFKQVEDIKWHKSERIEK